MSATSDGTSSNENSSTPSRTPAWALGACKAFIDQTQQVSEILDLCMRGLRTITSFPEVVSVLASVEGTTSSPKFHADKKRAEEAKARAEREIDAGFPTLHAQATVSLWSSLESMVKDLVSDWICNKPEILSHDLWANLKVRLGDYEPLDSEQRADYLVELADLNASAPLKQGVKRFERLLETIGLEGSVSDATRKTLFELQQVRNVLVHRQGNADQKFRRACPWINAAIGQPVVVSAAQFSEYQKEALAYATELIIRTGEAFGIPDMRSDHEARLAMNPPKEP